MPLTQGWGTSGTDAEVRAANVQRKFPRVKHAALRDLLCDLGLRQAPKDRRFLDSVWPLTCF